MQGQVEEGLTETVGVEEGLTKILVLEEVQVMQMVEQTGGNDMECGMVVEHLVA